MTITVEPMLNDTPKLSNDPELMDTPVKSTIYVENPPKAIESPKRGQSPDLSVTPRVMRKKLESNLLLTNTPQMANILLGADVVGNCSTPIVSNHIMRRGSMSPITKSTQKMPKAMQVCRQLLNQFKHSTSACRCLVRLSSLLLDKI